ncbi:MAG: TonB family protein [Cyclobacteriaceae bacterium]|nr:TonB family protein [Cyclobacteriaceae bacterium]MCB9238063.1 TonB family protein [Flammeovirgaceae bacterium]MCO5272545.1 TonB family protein [Cyclobacteriaceae bacterium]MCW5901613.1 TonB family protein [Cyclobacteriaceae bacterium]
MGKPNNDIEKYLKGELSPAEMHKLEKQALHDPFLADALEGAESIGAGKFAQDVASLNRKIRSKGNRKYIWPLRMAASLMLVAIAYFLVRNEPAPGTGQMALQKDTAVAGKPAPMAESPTDKKTVLMAPDTDRALVAANKSQLALKREGKPGSTMAPAKRTQPETEPQEASKTMASELAEADVIVPPDEEGIAMEGLKVPGAQGREMAEKEKAFDAKTEAGRARPEAKKRSAPSLSSGAANDASLPRDSNAVARPSTGQEAYMEYLATHVSYPTAAIDHHIGGEVVVSFTVNRDGTLSRFHIEKGIGFGCDEELVRLVKTGPKWLPAIKGGKAATDRARVAFVFDHSN